MMAQGWITGGAFALGLALGAGAGSTVASWMGAEERADALASSNACQTGRADANAAAATTTTEIQKDLSPVVDEQRNRIAGLERQLELARLEVNNDPRPMCLGTPDDVARMQRIDAATGDAPGGDLPRGEP